MSAAHTLLAWDTEQELEAWTAQPATQTQGSGHVRQIGSRNAALCPECRSIIYCRRHKFCGVCNQPLPEHLLFSPSESQRLEELLRSERCRHRKWMSR